MIKHIVMWKLKDSLEGKSKLESMQAMKAMLEALIGKVDGLIKLEVGFNIESSDSAYDLVLYSEFTDEKALEAYQVHPDHLVVKKFVAGVRDKRAVVDYLA